MGNKLSRSEARRKKSGEAKEAISTRLGLTIPLQKRLRIKVSDPDPASDKRYCWDLHIIALYGRQSLLATHCASRYTFILFDLSSFDWRDIQGTFIRGLKESLSGQGFPEKLIRAYLDRAGEPRLTKTHGRWEVAFMNRAWEDALAADYAVNRQSQSQPLLDSYINDLPRRRAGDPGLGPSLERLRWELENQIESSDLFR